MQGIPTGTVLSHSSSHTRQKGTPSRRLTVTLRLVLILVIGPTLVYAWLIMRAAREIRIRSVLDRNLHLAVQNARLLDAQCTTAVAALQVLSTSDSFLSALRNDDQTTVERHLRRAVVSVPDLMFVAAYRRDGRFVSGYPRIRNVESWAARQTWFQAVIKTHSLHVSAVTHMPGRRGECLSLALPVGSIRYPVGILLAYYRLINTEKWLPAVGAHGDTRFYFLNLQGQPVSGTNPPAVPPPLRDRAFLRQAAQEKQGTRIFSPDRGTNRRLVAFALASRPRWLVSVGQSLPSALETIHFMSWRLALLSLPILALPLITAVVLVRQFRIQETLTARLEAQNRQLKTEEQAKSDFLAHVSHDLWTPLASVQLSLSSMLDPNVTWTPAESHRSLRLALGETERLIGRVRNLLEMARLDINDSTLPKEPCVLQDIVEAILERMKPLLQQHPVEQVFPEEPLLIEGRPAQIEVVLMNLLENALKYSPAGTPLHLGAQCRREEVYFTLRDHGPGAPREVRDRIFDPFFRTQKEGSRSGVGLGLALCRKIIEKHGGLIGVMNAPEGGAIFWFTLPLLPSQGVDWQ